MRRARLLRQRLRRRGIGRRAAGSAGIHCRCSEMNFTGSVGPLTGLTQPPARKGRAEKKAHKSGRHVVRPGWESIEE